MRTERDPGRRWVRQGRLRVINDEVVALFRIAGKAWIPTNSGQDVRVNIHLCQVNCAGARIVVAGKALRYFDGSLFAFEDGAGPRSALTG